MQTAQRNDIEYITLGTGELESCFPHLNLVGNEEGYYELGGGYIHAERSVRTMLALAQCQEQRPDFHWREFVTDVKDNGSTVTVSTNQDDYEAKHVIITTGPWINNLAPEYRKFLKVYRQVLYWFAIENKDMYKRYREMPVFLWDFGPEPSGSFYGFPPLNGLDIKVATEQWDSATTPETIDRRVSVSEIAAMYQKYVAQRLRGIGSFCVKSSACMYTAAQDKNFVLGHTGNVQKVSPCSGHGFKYAPAIGELLMQLALNVPLTLDASCFDADRFAS